MKLVTSLLHTPDGNSGPVRGEGGVNAPVQSPRGTEWYNPSGDRGPKGEQTLEGVWDGSALRPFKTGDTYRGDPNDKATAPAPVEESTSQDGEERAEPETERPAEDTHAATDEEQETAADTEEPGKDEQSPGKFSDDAIEKIVAKFETPEALARSYKGLQRLQSLQGERLHEARVQIAKQLEILERDYEQAEDGKYQLRTEAAVRRLEQAAPPPMQPDVNRIRQEVVAEYQQMAQDLDVDPESMETFWEKAEPQIKAKTRQRAEQQYQAAQEYEQTKRQKAYGKTQHYFQQHPEYESVRGKVNDWLLPFPEAVRADIVNNGYFPLDKIARLEYAAANIRQVAQQAYEAGRKAGGGASAPTTEAPASGARTPRSRALPADEDSRIKADILNAGDNAMLSRLRRQGGGLDALFD